jgi:glycosyltransferase involved in cell wall biosynthesis
VRIACVIHRFGADIAGGSEGHCLQVARRLAASHDVTVLTTCARDHVTWRNEYSAGATTIDGGSAAAPRLRVERFPVARERSLGRFAEISNTVFDGRPSEREQEEWFRQNGPESPALLDRLARGGPTFDRVLFWSFRYYHAFFGLPLVADRAILLPTAEEDEAIRLDVLDRFFSLPAAFMFLTPEEQQLVARRCSQPLAPSSVVGCGVEAAAPTADAARLLDSFNIAGPFALYLGRVDPNKGCDTLLRYFRWIHGDTDRQLWNGSLPLPRLVMAGPVNMPLPNDAPWLTSLGYVDAPLRDALLSQSAALIVPSPYESLSMVLIEAWNHGKPALVSGRCAALKGQAIRSGGALYYRSVDEFAQGLAYLLEQPDAARQIGANGLAYVEREYRWPQVMDRIEELLCSLPSPASRLSSPATGLSAASSARA